MLKKTQATEVLFHHRYPTSTANVQTACHPFSTKNFFESNYILVHNGVLSNEDDLKEEHEKLGIKYVSEQQDGSFNDSESLMWDIALTLEGKQEKMKAYGSIAFIMIERDKNGKHKRLLWARNNGNPLEFVKNKREITIASTSENPNAKSVEENILHWYNYSNGSYGSKEFKVPRYNPDYNYVYQPSKYNGDYNGYRGGYNWGEDDSTQHYVDEENYSVRFTASLSDEEDKVYAQLLDKNAYDRYSVEEVLYDRSIKLTKMLQDLEDENIQSDGSLVMTPQMTAIENNLMIADNILEYLLLVEEQEVEGNNQLILLEEMA